MKIISLIKDPPFIQIVAFTVAISIVASISFTIGRESVDVAMRYDCYSSEGHFVRYYFLDPRIEKTGYPVLIWEQGPNETVAYLLSCVRTGGMPP